jgi:hypothetical protein
VALETVGHRSGRRTAVPVVLADHAGERYVVSMLGERSPWAHNVRAAGGRVVIRHGRRHAVRLVEVEPEARAPVIKAYLDRAVGARPHIPVDHSAPSRHSGRSRRPTPSSASRGEARREGRPSSSRVGQRRAGRY